MITGDPNGSNRFGRFGGGCDRIHYPESDDMGESGLQLLVCQVLMDLLRSFFVACERQVLVGGNQFFYFRQGDPGMRVAPDVYVIEDEATPLADVRSWKVWEREGKVPSLAVEVVSEEYQKDYSEEMVARYQELGVRELFRYDPLYYQHPRRTKTGQQRRLLAHFVRDEAGVLAPRAMSSLDRARSVGYEFWMVHQVPALLRLGLGPHGDALWPTSQERAEAEARRAAAEAERALKAEAERATVETERAKVEAENAQLRAEIERLRAGR